MATLSCLVHSPSLHPSFPLSLPPSLDFLFPSLPIFHTLPPYFPLRSLPPSPRACQPGGPHTQFNKTCRI